MNNEINEFKNLLNDDYDNKYPLIKEGLYLNIFVYDKDWRVRWNVAEQGYYHDILQYDKSDNVRDYVVRYTNDKSILEHLSNDNNEYVTYEAKRRLKELGYG